MSAVQQVAALVEQIGRVLVGKREVTELAVTGLLARGHVLVEDVPGVGKTTLARAIARSIGVPFGRIQFTSDLLPADVIGGSIYDSQRGTLTFRPGPVFTSILLADEINRTPPRTQSALLEAMEERRISIEGQTHVLEEPFFVIATQNPEEFHGTFALPESQLDRFLVRLEIGYPPPDLERALLRERRNTDPLEGFEPVLSKETLLALQDEAMQVRVDDEITNYLHDLVLATRTSQLLSLGASTRAALAWERAVRARALVCGRTYAVPDDVRALAVPVLSHRVKLASGAEGARARRDAAAVVRELVAKSGVPI